MLVEPSPEAHEEPHVAQADALGHGRLDRRPALRVSRADDVLVVEPQGLLQPEAIHRIQRLVACPDHVVVVDLHEAVVRDVELLLELLAGQRRDRDPIADEPKKVCLVSRCRGCRCALARAGIADVLAVFSSVDDALQARAVMLAGYGRGWS